MATIYLKDLCQAIAEALGPEWSSGTPTPNNPIWDYCLARTTDGLELNCRADYRQNRVEIQTSGIASVTPDHRVIFSYHTNNPTITVSAKRDPKAIARDIRNRLLPEATAWWQQGMISKQVAEEQYAQAQQLQARLLIFPGAATFKPTYTGEDVKVKGPDESCSKRTIN
jgi:hypothetical protein